jgi:hypothetical protein
MPHEDDHARRALTLLTVAALLASFTHYFGFLLAMAGFLLGHSWQSARG